MNVKIEEMNKYSMYEYHYGDWSPIHTLITDTMIQVQIQKQIQCNTHDRSTTDVFAQQLSQLFSVTFELHSARSPLDYKTDVEGN